MHSDTLFTPVKPPRYLLLSSCVKLGIRSQLELFVAFESLEAGLTTDNADKISR
jgi:hypothetical protein